MGGATFGLGAGGFDPPEGEGAEEGEESGPEGVDEEEFGVAFDQADDYADGAEKGAEGGRHGEEAAQDVAEQGGSAWAIVVRVRHRLPPWYAPRGDRADRASEHPRHAPLA